jgi:hypothetical protein
VTDVHRPQAPAIRSPVCPTCHEPMRLESSRPDRSYANLRHMIFVCACGRASDQLVADSTSKRGRNAVPPAIASNRKFINGSWADLSHFKRYTTWGQRELIHSLLAVADSYAMLGRPLETLPQVEALIQKYFAPPPSCTTCNKLMHVHDVKLNKTRTDICHVLFSCDCGRLCDRPNAVAA